MTRRKTALLVITASVGMIIYGMMTGQVNSVFNKAINICLECIGIG